MVCSAILDNMVYLGTINNNSVVLICVWCYICGHVGGVAAQTQQEEPAALFVHCFAHSVNLC